MREIKFRAWDGEDMISPDYVNRNGYAHWIENSIPCGTDLVMQYTGLKDKNGVEIFEGDIVKYGVYDYTSEVYYNGGMCGFYPLISINARPLEVIGNIHQTPELI